MGVTQGSILGPFLFLVYINDLPYLVGDSHDIVLFADDTFLIFKLKRQSFKCDEVNNAISKLVHWFNVNNLHLNGNKTNCVKFPTTNVKNLNANVFLIFKWGGTEPCCIHCFSWHHSRRKASVGPSHIQISKQTTFCSL
ncbi:unnamed protein product [Parnassius mnemosyne]|uniref:Reverse transcriptase domain-containing protein n=1 Tax=Parnassius mnemosyne TaxID=213953 RepID=A0AAV1K6B3_9NEOP